MLYLPNGNYYDMRTKKELPPCPVETTLTLIGDKWKLLILRDLMSGTKRFGELRKSVGNISQKVLTENLREMESDKLLKRKVYAQVPPKVEYSLTELGESLNPIIESLRDWGNSYKKKLGVVESLSIPHNLQHQRTLAIHSFAVKIVVGAVADLLPYPRAALFDTVFGLHLL